MNALIPLSIKLNIRLMLVGVRAFMEEKDIHNLALNSVFLSPPCMQADQHQSNEV